MRVISVLGIRGINDANSVGFNAIAIGFAGMIELEHRYAGSTQFHQVTRRVFFKGYPGAEHFKAHGEKGRLHLVSDRLFDFIVPSVDDDFVPVFVGGSEEGDALNVIVMKVRKKKVESRARHSLTLDFLPENPESRSPIHDQILVGARLDVHAGGVASVGSSVLEGELFLDELSNLAFGSQILPPSRHEGGYYFLPRFKRTGGGGD